MFEGLFKPLPQVQTAALPGLQGAGSHAGTGAVCAIVDDAMLRPRAWVEWAAAQRFYAPDYPYPGLVCEAPAELRRGLADFFTRHVRRHLGLRRLLQLDLRFSLITTPPEALVPVQWLCHRDRLAHPGSDTVFAACVLYLFEDPVLGGTSFYAPRRGPEDTETIVADSQRLDAAAFSARHGLRAGYIGAGNRWFKRVASAPPAFNRAIFYDGSVFHSADVGRPERMVDDARRGRLTLNAFFTTRRNAV